MIFVDDLQVWPAWESTPRLFRDRPSCHLTTSGHVDELHVFAAKIGMKRAWFQQHLRWPHYDLTPKRRARAVELGAVELPLREQVIARRVVAGLAALFMFAAAEREDHLREAFIRAGAECECPACGRLYSSHVTDVYEPWLTVLCTGRRVKL